MLCLVGWSYPIKSVPVYRDLPVPKSGSIYKSTIRDPWLGSCISSGSDGAQMGEREKRNCLHTR
jgi:hypothetical protein